MAKRKTAKQVAASRKNIRKAQIVSARKRRGKGMSRNKKIALGAAAVGAVAVAGVATRHHVREKGLQKKHGENFVPKRATYHHYTNNNAARRIAKTRSFKPTGKHGGHGAKHGVWLTTGAHDGLTRDAFGKARVSVRLSRKTVLGARTHAIPGGLDKSNKKITHIQLDKKALKGKRIRHNLPKSAAATRRRANAYRRVYASKNSRDRAYSISRNMAVRPLLRKR